MSSGNTLCTFLPNNNEPPASNPATPDLRNQHPILNFDTTTQEAAIFTGVMPRNYAGGGVTVSVHWCAASATSGTIGWDVSFERIGAAQQDIDSDGFASAQTITAATVDATSGNVSITNVAIGLTWTLSGSPAALGTAGGFWTSVGGAPDSKQAIGITDAGVTGCDKYTPSFTWQRTVPFGIVTLDYLRTLESLVGTKNDATFYGRAAGEQLFLGASGQCGQGKRWDVTFKFASESNRTNIDVGGGIVIPAKRGWDYLWVRYGRGPEVRAAGARSLLSVPKFAYVEEIYEDGDFSGIGIGV